MYVDPLGLEMSAWNKFRAAQQASWFVILNTPRFIVNPHRYGPQNRCVAGPGGLPDLNAPLFNQDQSGRGEHTKNARPSTKGKHEQGTARKKKDRGAEKGDIKRTPPRKRPDKWKGPWPPE